MALHQVFGDHARKLEVSGTKAYYGHALGASGAFETAITALAIARSWLPPTLNLESPGDGCDLDYIPRTGRAKSVEYAMTNSFGFGGVNATLVLRRAE
jgi:3-oxoacyl-[acyl-carrier-protein] synthase II